MGTPKRTPFDNYSSLQHLIRDAQADIGKTQEAVSKIDTKMPPISKKRGGSGGARIHAAFAGRSLVIHQGDGHNDVDMSVEEALRLRDWLCWFYGPAREWEGTDG